MIVLVSAAGLFAAGLYGVLTRRDMVAVLASIEVMLGGALVLLVALGASSASRGGIEAIALIALVVTAAEAAVGLALVVAAARRTHTTRIDELKRVRG